MKKTILVIISLIFTIAFLPAQAAVSDPRAVTFVQTGTEGSLNVYRVDYPKTHDILIMTEGVPGNYEKEAVWIFLNEISAWDTLEIRNVKIIFRKEAVEVNVLPASLKYKDKEYSPYLPAGITFIYTQYPIYDFRLVKDNYFARIRGQYFSPDLLLAKIEEAAADPAKYIAAHDPEFMVRQISDINVRDTKQDGEISRLKSELERVSESYRKLLDDFETLRYAYVSETKRGIYGRKTPFPPQDIDAILEIRKANPSASLDEIYDTLSARGTKISKSKIAVILNSYLGEYPE